MNEDFVKPIKLNEFAKLLNVSIKTLQRWDNDGILKAHRTPTNRRYYTYDQYVGFLKSKYTKKVILYSRVLLEEQIEDLKKQEDLLINYSKKNNFEIIATYKDINNGLCSEREGFKEIINKITNNKIDAILITTEDRLTIFYYLWFKEYFNKYGTEIISLGCNELIEKDIMQEISHNNKLANFNK